MNRTVCQPNAMRNSKQYGHVRPQQRRHWRQNGFIPVNVLESPEKYIFEFVLPMWNKDNITIAMENDLLTVEGKLPETTVGKDATYLRRNYQLADFVRRFQMPKKADANKINAEMKNGVLYINIEKMEEAKGPENRTIKIK